MLPGRDSRFPSERDGPGDTVQAKWWAYYRYFLRLVPKKVLSSLLRAMWTYSPQSGTVYPF